MTTGTRRTFMLMAKRIDLVKKGFDQNGNPSELYKVMADIPEFESQYEYGITNVPGEDARRMTQGESYCVVLEMGRLKTGKESDTPYLYNYWWNWKGFGSPENIEAAATQPIARAAAEAIRSVPAVDHTRQSIERQVALKESNLVAQWLLGLDTERSGHKYEAEVARLYPLFFDMLHNGAPDSKEDEEPQIL